MLILLFSRTKVISSRAESLHNIILIEKMWFVYFGFVAIDQAVLLEVFSLLQDLLEEALKSADDRSKKEKS